MDLKFKMGGRIKIILMCVKFNDDPISDLDFSFIGGCDFKKLFLSFCRRIEIDYQK